MSFDPLSQDIETVDLDFPASSQLLTFMSHGLRLNGRIFMAQGAQPHPTILLLHGYPGVEQNHDLAHVFRRMGWHVVIFHYRGAWGSEGDFSLTHVLEDIEVAIAYLVENAEQYRIDPEKIVLMGHSMGGFATLMMGAKLARVKAVASLACFNFGRHAQYIQDEDDRNQEAILWGYEISPLKGTSGKAIVDEMMAHQHDWDLETVVPALANRPVCLINGSRDFVSPATLHHTPLLQILHVVGASAVSEHTLDSDHSFSDKRVELAQILVNWLRTLNF